MRPPVIHAVALLAAHGHLFAARDLADRRPLKRKWRRPMSDDVRYALLTDTPGAKPRGFADLDALARHIQRERGQMALHLETLPDLEVTGDRQDRPGVSVFTAFEDGSRDRLIGHAWIDGLTADRAREVLQSALRRNRLVVVEDDTDPQARAAA